MNQNAAPAARSVAFDAPRRCSVELPGGRWGSRPWTIEELRIYRQHVLGRRDPLNYAAFDIAG